MICPDDHEENDSMGPVAEASRSSAWDLGVHGSCNWAVEASSVRYGPSRTTVPPFVRERFMNRSSRGINRSVPCSWPDRERTTYPNDPTRLAYCCFADPMARVMDGQLAAVGVALTGWQHQAG